MVCCIIIYCALVSQAVLLADLSSKSELVWTHPALLMGS